MGKTIAMILVLVPFALLYTFIIPGSAQEEIPRITIQELKSMIDQGAEVVILDTQPKAIYHKGHVKGAISFPWKAKIATADAARLPRNKLVVTYCDCGPGESDSTGVASQLLGLGFENIKVLKDPSIRGWKSAGYPME